MENKNKNLSEKSEAEELWRWLENYSQATPNSIERNTTLYSVFKKMHPDASSDELEKLIDNVQRIEKKIDKTRKDKYTCEQWHAYRVVGNEMKNKFSIMHRLVDVRYDKNNINKTMLWKYWWVNNITGTSAIAGTFEPSFNWVTFNELVNEHSEDKVFAQANWTVLLSPAENTKENIDTVVKILNKSIRLYLDYHFNLIKEVFDLKEKEYNNDKAAFKHAEELRNNFKDIALSESVNEK